MGYYDFGAGQAPVAPRKPLAPMDPTLSAIGTKYKALAPYMPNSAIVQTPKAPGDDRHLEFYPPYEEQSPRPGKITFELFDKMNPQSRENAVAADALHHLGGYADASKTTPVDPAWMNMKNELMANRNPAQRSIDEHAFAQEHEPGDTMDTWLQRSRADAYIRAGLFPAQNPDWQRAKGDPEGWTPGQESLFGRMSGYLRNGPTEPPPFDPERTKNIARGLGGAR